MIPVIQSRWLHLNWSLHLPQYQEEGVATYSSVCFGHFLPWLQAALYICHTKPGNSVDRTSEHVSIGIQLIDHQCHVSLEQKKIYQLASSEFYSNQYRKVNNHSCQSQKYLNSFSTLGKKLVGYQLVKTFCAFCGTGRFITVFSRANHLT
jgi:hypothetical protein